MPNSPLLFHGIYFLIYLSGDFLSSTRTWPFPNEVSSAGDSNNQALMYACASAMNPRSVDIQYDEDGFTFKSNARVLIADGLSIDLVSLQRFSCQQRVTTLRYHQKNGKLFQRGEWQMHQITSHCQQSQLHNNVHLVVIKQGI